MGVTEKRIERLTPQTPINEIVDIIIGKNSKFEEKRKTNKANHKKVKQD